MFAAAISLFCTLSALFGVSNTVTCNNNDLAATFNASMVVNVTETNTTVDGAMAEVFETNATLKDAPVVFTPLEDDHVASILEDKFPVPPNFQPHFTHDDPHASIVPHDNPYSYACETHPSCQYHCDDNIDAGVRPTHGMHRVCKLVCDIDTRCEIQYHPLPKDETLDATTHSETTIPPKTSFSFSSWSKTVIDTVASWSTNLVKGAASWTPKMMDTVASWIPKPIKNTAQFCRNTVNHTVAASNKKVDDTVTAFHKKVDDTVTAFHQKVDDTVTAVQKKVNDSVTAFHKKVDDEVTAFHKKVDDAATAFHKKVNEAVWAVIFWVLWVLEFIVSLVVLVVATITVLILLARYALRKFTQLYRATNPVRKDVRMPSLWEPWYHGLGFETNHSGNFDRRPSNKPRDPFSFDRRPSNKSRDPFQVRQSTSMPFGPTFGPSFSSSSFAYYSGEPGQPRAYQYASTASHGSSSTGRPRTFLSRLRHMLRGVAKFYKDEISVLAFLALMVFLGLDAVFVVGLFWSVFSYVVS